MNSLRRSLLYIPGNNPGMIQNAGYIGADFVVFDLEDAISYEEKDSARLLVKYALENVDFNGVEIAVRINSWNSGLTRDDLESIIPAEPDIILLPMVENAEDIIKLSQVIKEKEEMHNKQYNVRLFALIETARGVLNCENIVFADERMVGLQFGAEDFTANIGSERTITGEELIFSRSKLILAAKSASISVIDTPYTNIDDIAGLKTETRLAKQLGFDGKAIISPKHIEIVNKIFSPEKEQIEWAERVIEAFKKGKKEGRGVVKIDGEMVDAPVFARAKQILKLSERMIAR